MVRVVVKFIGSKNQSIRGKSWAPLLTFQERLMSIPDFSSDRVGLSLLFVCSTLPPIFVPFGLFFFWPLYCLSSYLWLRIVSLLSSNCSVPQVYHKSRVSDRGALSMGDFQVVIRTD